MQCIRRIKKAKEDAAKLLLATSPYLIETEKPINLSNPVDIADVKTLSKAKTNPDEQTLVSPSLPSTPTPTPPASNLDSGTNMKQNLPSRDWRKTP